MTRLLLGAACLATAVLHAAPVSAFQQANNATSERVLTVSNDLPSLKMRVHAKRDTLKIHGRFDFDIIATPVVTSSGDGQTSVYYNGFARFMDGDSVYSYHLVDGAAYYTTKSTAPKDDTTAITCVPPQARSPVHQFLEAFNAAVPTSIASYADSVDCPNGYLWQASFLGEQYAVCTKRASAAGFTITGGNFDVDVVYLPVRVDIKTPTVDAAQLQGCTTTPISTTLTTATLGLLSGKSSPSWSDTIPRQETSSYSSCACKGKRRACLFVHGLGRSGPNTLVDSFDYFGYDMANHAPCCTSIKYASLNTIDNAWHGDVLRTNLCRLALVVSATSSGITIRDTIIVTHSMGNLILASAIASGDCALDQATTTWVGTSGPMKGSMASDYLQSMCASNSFLSFVAGLMGQCPANTAVKNLAYQGETYALSGSAISAKYTAAQDAYRANVKAVMCSNDYDGLGWTTDQAVYWAAGDIIPHKTYQHDGIVEYDSCRGGLLASKFGNHYSYPFYVTTLNHMDTTFRNGDAYWDTAEMPIKWFECLL